MEKAPIPRRAILSVMAAEEAVVAAEYALAVARADLRNARAWADRYRRAPIKEAAGK